jgi:predicted RNA-binding Zn ribbon-like protein
MRTIENLQLDGGCLVFDFTNTVNTRRPAPEHEYLKSFEDFLQWSAKVGALPKKKLQQLREHATRKQKLTSSAFRDVIDVRENLYQLFSSIAERKSPEASVVNAFNERLSLAFNKLNMRFSATGAEVYFNDDKLYLEEPVDVIMKAAYDILTEEDFLRIRECPRCGWLFLDTSKNGRRRWCNMNVCGSREKALEYYYRKTKTS